MKNYTYVLLGLSVALGACGREALSSTDDETGTEDGEESGDESSDGSEDTEEGEESEDTGTDDGPDIDLEFGGIETAAWDGEDGLTATWSPAVTEDAVEYRVVAEAKEGGEVFYEDVGDVLEGTVSGLPDGEYKLWVEAIVVDQGKDDGDRFLWQLVGPNRIAYRSEVPLVGGADVWGHEDLVAMAGWHSDIGFMLVDISDVENPEVLSTVSDIGVVKDVKLDGELLFATSECECNPDGPKWEAYEKVGLRIFDITDPTDPIKVGEIADPVTSVHNAWWEAPNLYIADNITGNVGIYDVTDPSMPTYITEWDTPSGRIHDMEVVDDLLYPAFLSGWAVVDVTDPSMPADIAVLDTGESGHVMHNLWPAGDGQHVLVTEEHKGGHVEIFDYSDPDNIVEVSEYQTDPDHMVHNVIVRDDFAFVSYYWDGLRVLDISDIESPVEIGWYDSLDEDDVGAGSLFDGNWGVWPFHDDYIAISDQQRGLILLEHIPEVVSADP